MPTVAQSVLLCAPQLVLAVGALLLVLLGTVRGRLEVVRALAQAVALCIVAGSAVATLVVARGVVASDPLSDGVWLFSGLLALDRWALLLHALVLGCAAISVALVRGDPSIADDRVPTVLALLLGGTAGLSWLAAAADALSAVVALTVVLVAAAGLSASHARSRPASNSRRAVHAGVALASTLFAFSWLYGLGGSTRFADLVRALEGVRERLLTESSTAAQLWAGQVALAAALTGAVAGAAFLAGVPPFRRPLARSIERVPASIALFLAAAVPAGAVALATRFLYASLSSGAPVAQTAIELPWPQVLTLAGAVTAVGANLRAVVARRGRAVVVNLAVARVGEALLGISAVSVAGTAAVVEQLIATAIILAGLSAIGAIGVAPLHRLRGLLRSEPLAGASAVVLLLALAGVPGTLGFIAKLDLVRAQLARGGWPTVVAIAAVASSVLALVAAVRTMRALSAIKGDRRLFRPPLPEPGAGVPRSPGHPALALAFAAAVLLLGWFPHGLRGAALAAAAHFLGRG